jgi:hypothetical protein
VSVDLPAIVDPSTGDAGEGDRLGPAPTEEVQAGSETGSGAPTSNNGLFGGILSRTGAETLPLARTGLGALALGLGLVILARRRRSDAASA